MKNLIAFKLPLSACILSLSCSAFTKEIEEIIVTSSLIDSSVEALSNPLHVITGESIATNASQSIGASIGDLVGLSSSDYGAAVGQPIIRGMSGNRVKILNNGLVVRDVSGLGPDHANDVDLNNIQQIEVVRGPSSLLYSSGTIGGIVNIVDNTIARKDVVESAFRLGLELQSVNNGDTQDFSYQNNIGGLNISAAFKDSQFDNFDIPNGAVIHDEDDHDDNAAEENLTYVPNSDSDSTFKRLGVSKTGDWGYFGLSFNDIENLYGIPFHGEEHDEHEEEGAESEEEHDGERIFSTTDSKAINLEGSYILSNRWLQKIDYQYRDSDYSLTEQHAEEEAHEEDETEEPAGEHHEEGPTVFKNDAKEFAVIFDLTNDNLAQKVALNFVQEDLSIIGEEAYINPTESKELTLGYYLSKDLDLIHLDFSVRHDQISRKGSVSHEDEHDEGHEEDAAEHEEELEYFDRDINNTSYALSLSRDINDSLEVNLGLASVERAPSAVELLMNGPHLATGRLEVGNDSLDSEKSNNIDLTFNYNHNGFFAALTFFQNDIDNFIYLLDETDDEHASHDEEEHHDELTLANYVQQDAKFNGYELEIGNTFDLARGALTLSFATDSVSGEFTDGKNVPRITPQRNIYKISYEEDSLNFVLSLKDVNAQNNTADGETATDGFQILNVNLSKTVTFGTGHDLTLSVFGKNLLNEVSRNHSSFVKAEVPMAGKNLGLRASYSF